MTTRFPPALDEHGNPSPGVVLGDDGSITVRGDCVFRPLRGHYSPYKRFDQLIRLEDGGVWIGRFTIPFGSVLVGSRGEVSIGGVVILGPKCLAPVNPDTDYGVDIRLNGAVRMGRLYAKCGRRVCLVAAHKAAKQRWTALRAAWVAVVTAAAPTVASEVQYRTHCYT